MENLSNRTDIFYKKLRKKKKTNKRTKKDKKSERVSPLLTNNSIENLAAWSRGVMGLVKHLVSQLEITRLYAGNLTLKPLYKFERLQRAINSAHM